MSEVSGAQFWLVFKPSPLGCWSQWLLTLALSSNIRLPVSLFPVSPEEMPHVSAGLLTVMFFLCKLVCVCVCVFSSVWVCTHVCAVM